MGTTGDTRISSAHVLLVPDDVEHKLHTPPSTGARNGRRRGSERFPPKRDTSIE